MTRYALYLGCTVPVRGINYEMAARKVFERLGIELAAISKPAGNVPVYFLRLQLSTLINVTQRYVLRPVDFPNLVYV